MVRNIAIVSLSAGTIGEDFVKHEVDIGLKRLAAYGCLLYTSPSPRDSRSSRMPSSA